MPAQDLKKNIQINMILTNQAIILAALTLMTKSEEVARLLNKAGDKTREMVEKWVDEI